MAHHQSRFVEGFGLAVEVSTRICDIGLADIGGNGGLSHAFPFGCIIEHNRAQSMVSLIVIGESGYILLGGIRFPIPAIQSVDVHWIVVIPRHPVLSHCAIAVHYTAGASGKGASCIHPTTKGDFAVTVLDETLAILTHPCSDA